MNIKIKLLSPNVYQDLFKFEQYNWNYFAQTVGVRPNSYRYYDSFVCAQDDVLRCQTNGDIAFYVIYLQGELVGRINLRDISSHNANLGYRTCRSACGKGIATFAVKKIINIAAHIGIKRINAVVSETNLASEKVLLKNGFQYSHTENNAVRLNGTMISIKHFYRLVTT